MEVRDIPGRGLGARVTRTLQPGEIILTELPIMLYPQASAAQDVCNFCLRWLTAPDVVPVGCPTCASAQFCSPQCATAAATDAASHCSLVCRTLSACNAAGLSDEDQSAIHFLIRACSMLLAAMTGDASAGARYSQLSSLAGRPPAIPSSASDLLRMKELHGRICHALSTAGVDPSHVTVDVIISLVERDEINGYGILAPFVPGEADSESDRKLRGSGIYTIASRVNHECLPNVARFDAFDAPTPAGASAGANTALQLRLLHALPAGEEVTQSYFPLTWSFSQRQQRCREQYGFICRCPRCKEESTWPAEERGEEEEEVAGGGGATMAATFHQGGEGSEDLSSGDVADAGYIHVFLFKFVCPREGCGGTMAPLQQQPHVLQCNVCDKTRTEEEFLAELEASN